MELRKTNKIKSEISFDEPLNIDWDGNELLLSDILGTDGDIIYKYIVFIFTNGFCAACTQIIT